MAHTCNPTTQEAEAGKSQVEGQPELHSEFKTSTEDIVTPTQICTHTHVHTQNSLVPYFNSFLFINYCCFLLLNFFFPK